MYKDVSIQTLMEMYMQGATDILHFVRLLNLVMAADQQPVEVVLRYDDITPAAQLVAAYSHDEYGLIIGAPDKFKNLEKCIR